MLAASQGQELTWRKSTRSASNGACVEMATVPGTVLLRDSKDPDGPVLRFAPQSWRDFVAAVREGELTI